MEPAIAGGQFTINNFEGQEGIALDSSQTSIEVSPQTEPGIYTVSFNLVNADSTFTSTFTVEIEVVGNSIPHFDNDIASLLNPIFLKGTNSGASSYDYIELGSVIDDDNDEIQVTFESTTTNKITFDE